MSGSIKSLLLGILLIVIIGIGGLVYRNAIEHPSRPIACPMDAKVCPDGTSVGRTGLSCDFPVCPPPNVSLDSVGLAFALPAGFATAALPDASAIAAYDAASASTTEPDSIVVRHYAVMASSTPLATIQATAIGAASGAPVPATAYSSATLGGQHFTVVAIGRFEGVVDTAYYLARESDVVRFDAIDRGVANWADPSLNVSALPAEVALRAMLATVQGE